MTEKPARKRRWLRFSLKTLLIVILLVGGLLGWIAKEMAQAERQRRAVEAIEKAGGYPFYDYQWPREEAMKGGSFGIGEGHPPGPQWLTNLAGQDIISDVVAIIGPDDGRFNDKDLEHLKGMINLEFLSFSRTQITDNGLEQLSGLSNLLYLSLNEAQVTDAGVKHLKGLTKLERLRLSDTEITDAGVEHLKGLTRLKYLDLESTHVTNEGINELRKALPNCEILWEPRYNQP